MARGGHELSAMAGAVEQQPAVSQDDSDGWV